jgi:hypothetical protein
MPCEPSGKGPRAQLAFNCPKVLRWLFIRDGFRRGEPYGLMAEQAVRIWDLEYELAIARGEINPENDFRK